MMREPTSTMFWVAAASLSNFRRDASLALATELLYNYRQLRMILWSPPFALQRLRRYIAHISSSICLLAADWILLTNGVMPHALFDLIDDASLRRTSRRARRRKPAIPYRLINVPAALSRGYFTARHCWWGRQQPALVRPARRRRHGR